MTDRSRPLHQPRVLLVTGGAGFIGSNLVRHLLAADAGVRVVVYDALTYAGNPRNLEGLETAYPGRYRFVQADICDEQAVERVLAEEQVDTIVHLAAESHVDRSIDGPLLFVTTNVLGTAVLLHAARRAWRERRDVRFHHVSTDEVFGSLAPGAWFTEETPYDPSSPYSAAKAGSDHLVRAWARTYGLPVTISNCSNNYGPYQFPEKLIPLIIGNALEGKPLPVYGDGLNERDWLYVADHCRAIDAVVRHGTPGRTYNVGGDSVKPNLEVVHLVCDLLDELRPGGRPRRELITFVKDRPGHDRRYAIDASRIKTELGWQPAVDFARGMRLTLEWYLGHGEWVEEIRSGRYRGERLGLSA